MSAHNNQTCEVAIIGLGSVGAALANLLGQMGISTVVLELATGINQLPRAVAFDDEVMRIFQAMGLSAEIGEISEVGEGAKFVDSAGKTLVHWQRPMEKSPNGWYLNYRFNQPDLERTLRDGTTRHPSVTLKPGCEVIDLQDKGNEVHVTYVDDGEERSLGAAYVVGCDGGRSFTRARIGAKFEDLGFHEEWLIVDLLLPEREAEPDRYTYHYCGFSRMGSKVFVGSKRKRWEFRLNDTDDRETVRSPETIWKILEPWISPTEAKLERTALYTFHSTIADNWRNGRILLAGDAAHQTPPFMAQGMCAGIRDASNLAWKLERVLRGASPEQLLDTYQSERSPHVREYIRLTIEFGKLINSTAKSLTLGNPTDIGEGRQAISQLRPKLGAGLSAGDTSHRGRLLPQFALSDGRLLDDVAGYRPALVLANGADEEFDESLWSGRPETGVEIVGNPGPELISWLREAGSVAVLIGADRNILGSARTIEEISVLHPSRWRYS